MSHATMTSVKNTDFPGVTIEVKDVGRTATGFIQWLRRGLCVVTACLASTLAGAQALHVEELANGTWFLLIAEPLADATTIAWPQFEAGSAPRIVTVSSGQLTLAAELDGALEIEDETSPPVVVAVGAASRAELSSLLLRRFVAPPEPWEPPPAAPLVEGGVERRLGRPGDLATLRLAVQMPPAADPRRAAVEVLWELLPQLLSVDGSSFRVRVDGNTASLESRVDPELAEIRVRNLRLELARLAGDPKLTTAQVEQSVQRVLVRRLAQLEEHPSSARHFVNLWLEGGNQAVQNELFGVLGVTVETLNAAATSWLPQHPGQAVLSLPPQVFNPRFATFPESYRLPNDLAVTVLERPGAALAAICLRPVLLTDVDGEISATVLTRLATEIRNGADVPGWVRVRVAPPVLELAGPPDAFAELSEVLQRALTVVGADHLPAAGADDARRRALGLLSEQLAFGSTVVPAELLRPSNLALGAVSPDAETAGEALRKFSFGGEGVSEQPAMSLLSQGSRSRIAAPGGRSVLVTVLELATPVADATFSVASVLLGRRARQILGDFEVETLHPLVPGRQMMLLVVAAELDLPTLESRVAALWPQVIDGVDERELAPVRRFVAVRFAREGSGSLGRARRCAAVAAGAESWQTASAAELEILGVGEEETTEVLAALAVFDKLQRVGAGILPVDHLED